MTKPTPKRMRAIAIREPGGPDVLEPIETDVPTPGPDDVLVRVAAAGINRPDVLQREGRYPLPADASPLPGLEIAGEVVATGAAVTEWKPGDRVMALTHGGGYAEYCAVNQGHCLMVPPSVSLLEAAGIPEAGFTVTYNVFMRGRLAAGETFLVHGGTSGIGTTAIQLAKATGCRVLTTAGSDEKCRFAEQLGADLAVNYRAADWTGAMRDWLGGAKVDVVLDMVAGDYVASNLSLMSRDGRYAIIAFLRGHRAELDLRPILGKRIVLTGSTLRPQTVDEKTAIRDAFRNIAVPLLESGAFRPVVYETFPLEEARRAHECMESGQHIGKIILRVD